MKLKQLNIRLVYIIGPRNTAADGISRIVFQDSNYIPNEQVYTLKKAVDKYLS